MTTHRHMYVRQNTFHLRIVSLATLACFCLAMLCLILTGSPIYVIAASPPSIAPLDTEISISDISFSPATVTIDQGTNVVWTNNGAQRHRVRDSNHELFDSNDLDPDQTFSFIFTVPGIYTIVEERTGFTGIVTVNQASLLVGHVVWQGVQLQPSQLQRQPITLTLKLGSTEVNYPSQTTDNMGFFTVSVLSLAEGTYSWRVKGPKSLASIGSVQLAGNAVTNVEMGLMRTGDANNDNSVSIADFSIMRGTFGKAFGEPGFEDRADFTEDNTVNNNDFSLLRGNFGRSGAPPISPNHE